MSIPAFILKQSFTSDCNFIAILDCLNPLMDISSPRRHFEDLRIKLIGKDKPEKIDKNLQLVTCKNESEFCDYLNKLEKKFTIPGFKPIIIIHAHGDKKKGLQLPDNSFVGWSRLIEKFRHITEKCGGDLTVIAAFCHSHELIKHLGQVKKLPFSFYYGYPSAISSGVIEDEVDIIYKSFIDDGGKTLIPLLSKLSIKLYGEYDFIKMFLSPALLMAANPEQLSKIQPSLSQKKLKGLVSKNINGPQSGIDSLFKKVVRGDNLSISLVEEHMYDTERRTYVLQSVRNYFNLIKKEKTE
ncbi:TPA: hypothetical protein KEW82_003978 [Citrobacter amalonaticus]|nr:hypothetical protein [Citrobacter amalonaticus]